MAAIQGEWLGRPALGDDLLAAKPTRDIGVAAIDQLCWRHGSRIQKQMIVVARLKLMLDYSFPGRQNLAWDVSGASFHAAPMLGCIGADQMDAGQFG